jgi:hypothetical protein
MPRLLVLLLSASTILACDSGRKLGIAGANCQASADCEDWLQCVAGVCADARTIERAKAEQAALDSKQAAAMDALSAELRALETQQKQLEAEKKALDDQLAALLAESEKQRLTAEKAALDAQLGKAPAKSKQPPHAGDPLAGP